MIGKCKKCGSEGVELVKTKVIVSKFGEGSKIESKKVEMELCPYCVEYTKEASINESIYNYVSNIVSNANNLLEKRIKDEIKLFADRTGITI